MTLAIRHAADVLLGGGVIAYPTEGVYGLGCIADDERAIERLLQIKQRDPAKGLILIAARRDQLRDWVSDADLGRIPPPEPGRPVTWIASPGPRVPTLVRGRHSGVAVRITSHRTAAALCAAVDSPITSTSANIAGRPVARNAIVLRRQFGSLVDYIVPGQCGPASGPSTIRTLAGNETLRAGTA